MNGPILAIDPGKSGGIAYTWFVDGVTENTEVMPMPKTEGDVDFALDLAAQRFGPCRKVAVLEQVSGYIKKPGGSGGDPGSSMFRFGEGFGFIKGCLMGLGFRVHMVRPQKWTKHFELGTKSACRSNTEWKNKLKACAQRLYPGTKVTLATADALLILEWARRNL